MTALDQIQTSLEPATEELAESPLTDPVAGAQSALVAARTELDTTLATVEQWRATAEEKRHAVGELERHLGGEALAAGPAALGELGARVAAARIEADAAGGAVVESTALAQAAAERVRAAEAVVLRAQATALRVEADDHEREVTQMLVELEKFDGARYVPWRPTRFELEAAGGTITYSVPRHEALRSRADSLDQQAEQVETRPMLVERIIEQRARATDTSDSGGIGDRTLVGRAGLDGRP